jgi:PAS domain S-box-containing protein
MRVPQPADDHMRAALRALRRANRALRLSSACARAIPAAATEEELFVGLCRKIVQQGGFRFAWVGRAEDDEDRTVSPVAQAGFQDGYLEAIRVSWGAGELGRGPTGACIRERRPIVNRDFSREPMVSAWRTEALAHGFVSSIGLPILEGAGRATGALTIYSDEADAFDDGEVALLMEVADHLAFGLRTFRERRARASAEERLQLALEVSQVGIYDLDVKTGETQVSPGYATILGEDPATFRATLSGWVERLHPDDRERGVAALQAALEGDVPVYHVDFRQRTKGGGYRWVQSTGSVVRRDASGAPLRFLGTHTDITERREADLALRESEARYRSIFEDSSSVMLIIDLARTEILAANHAACAFYGYSQAELRAMSLDQITVMPAGAVEAASKGMAAGTLRRFETLHRLADGTLRDVEIFAGPISIGGRAVLHVILHDVTARKQAEAMVAHLAGRAETLLALPRMAEEHDEETFTRRTLEIVELITDSGCSCVCFAKDDEVGLGRALWSSSALERHELGALEAMRESLTNTAWRDELCAGRPIVVSGADPRTTVPGLDRLVVVPVLEKGRLMMVLALGGRATDYHPYDVETAQLVANDVWHAVQRGRTEAARRELALVVEQSPESVVITDLLGRIEYVNEAFVRGSGYSRDEVLGRNPRILKSGRTTQDTYQDMWSTLTRGELWRGEFVNQRRDGSEYAERALVSPIRDVGGKVTHYVAIKQDVTETRRLEAELTQHRFHLEEIVQVRTLELVEARQRAEEASRAKSTFLANMSHEIRTPMNAILGFAQLLRRDGALAPGHRAYVETILRSGEHLLALINDILEMSRIEAGSVKLHPELVDLHAFFAGIRDMFALAAEGKALALRFERPAEVPRWATTDAGKLRQVLVNLIGNAVKFTTSGEVRVTIGIADPSASREGALRPREGEVTLAVEVRDTGPGISADAQARIFRPFVQADAGRRVGGTGLGLAISREFVRLLGGEIRVSSEVSVGSSFSFTVPIELSAPALHASAAPPRHASRLSPGQVPRRILVVDDDATNRDLLLQLLGRIGFLVRTASDGRDARAVVDAWQPDLVLMDLRMPGEGGLEATRRIRARQAASAPRIVALSASAFAEDRAEALDAGADAFLAKPFREEDLLEALRAQLGVEYEAEPQAPPSSVRGSASVEPGASLAGGPPSPRPALTAEGLRAHLSEGLIGRLADATRAADLDGILELIAEAEDSAPAVARELRVRAEQFEYAALAKLFVAEARASADR